MCRIALVLLCLASFPAGSLGQSLTQVGAIDVPGPKGERFDYLTMDDEDHYLLSAHLSPGILYVIDVRTNALVKAIPGVPGITGVEYVPGLHKAYTSDWGEEKIGVVDLRQMLVVRRLPTAAKPNGSTYAAPFRKVYIANINGKAVTVVNVDTAAPTSSTKT
jgi:DNA-binding beta-propeller fold protein YncE